MSTRSAMIHRCSTERDSATATRDSFNSPVTEPTNPLNNHPCYWQVGQARFNRLEADGDKVVEVDSSFLLLPLESDIKSQDRVLSVKNRRGKVLYGTTLRVLSANPREDHLEVSLEAYS